MMAPVLEVRSVMKRQTNVLKMVSRSRAVVRIVIAAMASGVSMRCAARLMDAVVPTATAAITLSALITGASVKARTQRFAETTGIALMV